MTTENKEKFVKSNGVYDFYTEHTARGWYVNIYPAGKTLASAMNPREWTRAKCSTRKSALDSIDFWATTMTEPQNF